MLMAQTRTRQDDGSQRRIGDVNSQSGWQQRGCARRQIYGVIETSSDLMSGGAGGGIRRQRELLADTRIQNLNVDFFHHNGSRSRRVIIGPGVLCAQAVRLYLHPARKGVKRCCRY